MLLLNFVHFYEGLRKIVSVELLQINIRLHKAYLKSIHTLTIMYVDVWMCFFDYIKNSGQFRVSISVCFEVLNLNSHKNITLTKALRLSTLFVFFIPQDHFLGLWRVGN